ncbi:MULTISPECIES: helix-turn-helix domain-containing protein [unclassified Microbacterium]|uniref:helix-turn-helix domain-containing protein n=1 Tax=unclassified Microbacterium TaxID=2609290 RepID=UPI003017B48B
MNIPNETINPIVANALLAAARESGMNQTQLAEAAGMSRFTVQKLLSGDQGIKVAQFITLANATDLTPADVMDRISAALRRRAMSADAATVTAEDNVTYIGHVKAPVKAAADTNPRTPPKE